MGRSIFLEVLDQPGTAAVVTVCTAIWLYIKQKHYNYHDVGMSYETVVQRHQYWRMVVSQLSHIELLHLLFNVAAVWSMGYAEAPALGGTVHYLKTSFVLLVVSSLICLAIYHVLVTYLSMDAYLRVTAVGYSCVAFGWMTLLALSQGRGARVSLLGMAHLPMAFVPFLSLLLTSLLIPNASFIGHLSGIIAGFLIWLGLGDWLTPYWSACLLVWVGIGILYGLVQEGVIGPPYVRISWRDDDIETGGTAVLITDVVPLRS